MTLTREVNGETVALSAAEEAAVRAEWAANEAALAALPPEIAMNKVRKALKRLGPGGDVAPEDYPTDSWWALVMAVVETLPERQRDEILDDLNTAPNMVLNGASTQMIKAAIGMSDAQFDAVGRLALTLS